MTLSERIKVHAREYAEKIQGKDFRKQLKGYWRASSMGKCARLQAYDFLGFKAPDFPIQDRSWSLRDGHVHEGDIIARIASLPAVKIISDNKSVKRKFKIKNPDDGRIVLVKVAGTPDVTVSDGGIKTIIEIKALQDSHYQEVARKMSAPKEYLIQLLVYQLLTGIHKGILFIKNRNNSDAVDFDVPLTRPSVRLLMQRQAKIQSLLDKSKMPKREFMLGSQECFYCSHSKRCWGNQKFKGYVHKEKEQKDVTVDLDDEPKIKSRFLIAAKTYEKAKRKVDSLSTILNDARDYLDRLMRKFKADGLAAEGYRVKRIFRTGETPSREDIKRLIDKGLISMEKNPSDYIRVDLPKVAHSVAEARE